MPSGIPTAVQEQADKARQMAENPEHPEAGSGAEQPEEQQQPAQPAPEEGPKNLSAEEELQKPLPADPTPGSDEEAWQHRYKTLKGKYDKELAQYNRRIRELEDQLQQQPQQPQQQESDLSQLREEYGDEDPMVKALEAERERNRRLEQTVQSLQGSAQESAEERFWADLNAQVPDWNAINDRQDFLEWLNRPDPMSGEIRDTLIQRHQANGDGNRAAAIFEAFLNEHPQARQEMRGESGKQPQQPGVQAQVEPTRTKTEPEPEQPAMYPLSEYQQFMQDITKGKYTADKADYWQREYSNAIAEGRIDYSR